MSSEVDADFGDEPVTRLPVPEVDAGTEVQLREFFHKHLNHERLSEKCYLDGRYFWRVLSSYKGLIPSEMYVRINQSPAVPAEKIVNDMPLDLMDNRTATFASQLSFADSPDPQEELALQYAGNVLPQPKGVQIAPFQLSVAFDGEDLRRTKGYPERYRLIKLIIDIADHPKEVRGIVHSNLIYIDTKKKTVKRFEPLFDAPYLHPIDKALKAFFNENLPDYHYTMSPEHPQKATSTKCPTRGMCSAFILKKAMLLLAHNPHHHDCQVEYPEAKGMLHRWMSGWSHKKDKRHQHREFVVHSQADYDREEIKILQFADAIESEYGPLPGAPEIEFGYNDFGNNNLGGSLLAGLGGLAAGALLGGALGGLGTSYYSPYSYSAPYQYSNYGYGYDDSYYNAPLYGYGPSIIIGGSPYGRNYGFGGGRPWDYQHHHHGDDDWWRYRHDRDWWGRGEYGRRREYGYGGFSNSTLAGAAIGGLGGVLLGNIIEGALLGGIGSGFAGSYLLSDPYSRNYNRAGYRHHHGSYRYYR